MSDISGLSSVTGAAVPIPSDVRAAGKDAENTYRAALGFERQLLEQLTKSMAKDISGGTGDGDDESGDGGASAATSAYNDMLPGTLADAVTNAGGLGLAHDLFLSMRSATS